MYNSVLFISRLSSKTVCFFEKWIRRALKSVSHKFEASLITRRRSSLLPYERSLGGGVQLGEPQRTKVYSEFSLRVTDLFISAGRDFGAEREARQHHPAALLV